MLKTKKIVLTSALLGLSLISYGMYKLLHPSTVSVHAPTGSFKTGFFTFNLTDASRNERYSDDPLHPHRELVVDAWYPVDKTITGQQADFFGPLSPFVKTDFSNITKKSLGAFAHFDTMKNHSLKNAPLASVNSSYPVILFSPGFGSPARLYTSLCEELASNGFIVLALNYPYVTSPVLFDDGRVILPTKKFEELKTNKEKKDQATLEEMETWVKDIQYVISQLSVLNRNDRFAGKIDTTAIGICGHSLGGAAAIAVSRQDNRIKACCNLDGRLRGDNAEEGFATPLMILLSDRQDAASQKEIESMKKLLHAMTNDRYLYLIKNTNHGSFTDFDNLIGKASTEGSVAFTIIGNLVHNFFKTYLKQTDKNELREYAHRQPEITLLKEVGPDHV